MQELDELVTAMEVEIRKAQGYLDRGLITEAQFNVLVAKARRDFEKNKADLFASLEREGLTNFQAYAASSSSSSKGAVTCPAPTPPIPVQNQSHSGASSSIPATLTSAALPQADNRRVATGGKKKRRDSHIDSDGGLSEGKRQRRPIRRYQVGDGSIFQTSEYQRSDRERRAAKTKEDLHTHAMRFLPQTWKCEKGKGDFRDMTVIVHPDGAGYTLRNSPVEGMDFFATAQAAVEAYIAGELTKHTLAQDVEMVCRTAATHRNYLQEMHDIQTRQQADFPAQQGQGRSIRATAKDPAVEAGDNAHNTPIRAEGVANTFSSSAAQRVGAPQRRRINSDDDEATQNLSSDVVRATGPETNDAAHEESPDEVESSEEEWSA